MSKLRLADTDELHGATIDNGGAVYNVKHARFGAVGDGVADDTAAIQAAIDAAGDNGGGIVFFPCGRYRITGITVAADNVRLSFDNGALLLYEGTGGVAVDFNNGSGFLRRCGFENLRVARWDGSGGAVSPGTGSWTDGAVGVRLMACAWMEGREIDVEGFEYGFQLKGAHGRGCAYNNFTIKRLFDNRVNLHLLVDGDGSQNNGYCNENKFSGGNLSVSGARLDFSDSWNLRIEHDPFAVLNNNVFWSLSFEGDPETRAFYIDGSYNALMWCRYEGATQGTFGPNSDRNVVFYGRGFRADLITDQGTRNNMFSTWGSVLGAGTLADEGAWRFSNRSSDNYPAVSILDPIGQNEVIRLKGNGDVVANGALYADQMKLSGNELLAKNGRAIRWGASSPEGSRDYPLGSLEIDGTNGLIYQKTTGAGSNTGWQPLQYVRAAGTGSRPSNPPVGWCYFDTTLGHPVWWDGSQWVDATGAAV